MDFIRNFVSLDISRELGEEKIGIGKEKEKKKNFISSSLVNKKVTRDELFGFFFKEDFLFTAVSILT